MIKPSQFKDQLQSALVVLRQPGEMGVAPIKNLCINWIRRAFQIFAGKVTAGFI
jgi:hypothetical protein